MFQVQFRMQMLRNAASSVFVYLVTMIGFQFLWSCMALVHSCPLHWKNFNNMRGGLTKVLQRPRLFMNSGTHWQHRFLVTSFVSVRAYLLKDSYGDRRVSCSQLIYILVKHSNQVQISDIPGKHCRVSLPSEKPRAHCHCLRFLFRFPRRTNCLAEIQAS